MPHKKPDKQDATERIRWGCERNVPIEIHKHTGDATTPVVRARMLWCDDEHVYLDSPQSIGREVRLSRDTPVEAYFAVDGELYAFSAVVASMNCRVRLNSSKVVDGVALTHPAVVKQGQRRARYRTSLALQEPIHVWMHRAMSDLESAPIDSGLFQGRLVDASDTGFGVLIDGDLAHRFKVFDRWFIRFLIPGVTEETVFPCEVRQVRTARGGAATRIGLMALPWPSTRELRRKMMPLSRYLASVERQLCKRAG